MTARQALSATSLLRAALLAAALVVLCWRLTSVPGLVAGALGAFAGVLLGERVAGTRLRLSTLLAGSALLAALGSWLSGLLVSWAALPRLLGPLRALAASETVLWLCIGAAAFGALRAAAVRYPSLTVLEAAVVGVSLAVSVAGHREGMVHRPLAISNWAWSRGIDPVVVLLLIGGVGSLLVAALLVSEERRRRLPLHFAGLLLLALFLASLVRITGLPQPRAAGDLGLTGEPQEAKEEPGGGGQGQPSPSPTPGGQGDLPFKSEYQQSGGNAPVAVVILHGDYSPPYGGFYFRQTAYSQFNGRRLVQATRGDVDQDVVAQFPSRTEDVPLSPPVSDQRMELRTTVGLLADHLRPFALDSPASMWPAKNFDPQRFRTIYGVKSHVLTLPYEQMLNRPARRPSWSDDQWRHYTDGPSDPRYGALANEMVQALQERYRTDPLAQAVAVKSWLDKNGIYSRRTRHGDDELDPTGSFLFGDRTGYCVHFAHAAVFLLRSRGVAARVGGGYAVEEAARGSGSTIMIRGGNAHAWPEIYIEGVGWVIVDISPERSLDPPMEAPDSSLQRTLGMTLRNSFGETEELPQQATQVTQEDVRNLTLFALGALLLMAYAAKTYRRVAPAFTGARDLHRVGYRATLDHLSDLGLRRAHGETRERFAGRSRAWAPSFEPLTAVHLGSALGSARATPPESVRALRGAVRGEVRRTVPTWRRILGLLDPISWLRVR
jgi:protein-glutamine gamma-glutamyltransferase